MSGEEIRDAVLALHQADPTWTDSTYEDGVQTEQNALYAEDGSLIFAHDYRLCCSTCGSPGAVKYPCPTVLAVGGPR